MSSNWTPLVSLKRMTHIPHTLFLWPVESSTLWTLARFPVKRKLKPTLPAVSLHPWVAHLEDQLIATDRYHSFDLAVQQALPQGIDEPKDWNITSARSFLEFASKLLTSWVPFENRDGTYIYRVIAVFYFIFDQPAIIDLQTSIHPSSIGSDSLPVRTWLSSWLLKYAQVMGEWLDNPASLTAESYQSIVNSPQYRMKDPCDYYIPDPESPTGGFGCFNNFFKRHLRDPSVRPISAPHDNRVIVFPADSTFDDSWPVDENSMVTIKSVKWPMKALLLGSEFSSDFAGGVWMHAFLNTFDYHRQHSPVSGKVVEAKIIQGLTYFNVTAKQNPATGQCTVTHDRTSTEAKASSQDPEKPVTAQLHAPDDAGYQFVQMRGCIVIDGGKEIGHVAVLPVGMAHVSSIGLSVKVGDIVTKGQEISWFQFGGSDIVLVFERKANLGSWATPQQHCFMGEQLAIANP
ncbi:MAG: hypothetical protein MMC33_002965 [Icmadophila ericetorum]|nr:hypothetical protein [Icmadophila ericetorum]